MPRTKLAKSSGDYICGEFVTYLNSLRYTDADIGRVLGITQQAANRKRHSQRFQLKEAALLFKDARATDEEILRIMRL